MAISAKKTTIKTKKKTTTATAKPAAKKTKEPVRPAKPAAVKAITRAERDAMVQQTAYFIAEKNNFQGNPHEHWLAAETQVASELAGKNVRVLEEATA